MIEAVKDYLSYLTEGKYERMRHACRRQHKQYKPRRICVIKVRIKQREEKIENLKRLKDKCTRPACTKLYTIKINAEKKNIGEMKKTISMLGG